MLPILCPRQGFGSEPYVQHWLGWRVLYGTAARSLPAARCSLYRDSHGYLTAEHHLFAAHVFELVLIIATTLACMPRQVECHIRPT